MRGLRIFPGVVVLLALTAPPIDAHDPPKTIRVADGIYLFVTPPYGEVGLDGNSIAILSDEGVLVFDSNGTPAAAQAVLTEIRKLTDKPVKYLVNSHWHWDHWYGSQVYTRAFPGIRVVAQEKTREMMMGPALEFNRPGLETQLPGYIASLEQKIAAANDQTPASQLDAMKASLAEARFFLDQKRNAEHVFPNLTFDRELTLRLGGRVVQVLHHDRAVTPGDTFLYLPKERIVVTGDLLVNPISFALSCYPTGWLKTLERIDALDAAILIPGHGEPLRDERLLHATMTVMRELLRQGSDAKARGLDPDQAKEEILPRLHEAMVAITGDRPADNAAFRVYLVDWYLHRVYDELDGRLTDAIAPIPPKSL
jgi:glyoxylase-like metal-dependent hydrolase (beta-lactamase superfamily II)